MDTAAAVGIVGQAALDALAVRMLDMRVFPLFLPNEPMDGTGRLGSTLPRCLHPLVTYLLGASADEIDAVAESIPRIWTAMFFNVDPVKRHERVGAERMAVYWLLHLVTERTSDGDLGPLASLESSRVWTRFPQLRPLFTDEQLLRLDSSLCYAFDGIRVDGHIIHWHPLLGMSPASSPQDGLTALLCDHAATSHNQVAVAIDCRCYTPIDAYLGVMVKDYWYGPPFSRTDLDDPHEVGVTVYRAPDESMAPHVAAHCLVEGISRTEFVWKTDKGIKTFEAEEVMSGDRDRQPRYLHSEYVMAEKHFRHIDGAVMCYNAVDRIARRSARCILPRTPRAHKKPKLFRLDGTMSVDLWATAMCLFFRGNPLVHEFLTGATGASFDP